MRVLFVVAMAAGLVFPAAAAPTDDLARRLIVGDWIASPAQHGTSDALYRALARYNPDGTGQVQVFHDAACSRLAFTRGFRWTIAQGVVVTIVPDGRRIADHIVSLDSQTMVLRLAGETRLEHRVRAATCSRQMAV
jgi:hypothetical protein